VCCVQNNQATICISERNKSMNFIRNQRRVTLIAGGAVTYVISVATAYSYLTAGSSNSSDDSANENKGPALHSPGKCTCHVDNPLRNQTYNKIAFKYDSDIDMDEFVMGIKLLRRFMLYWYANGNVLEVGAGTGRNLKYYPMKNINRVLISDTSFEMLSEAKKKISELPLEIREKFITSQLDAENLSQVPDSSFDTVVDSFGLCSFDDPVAVLKELQRVCKPNGKILLLEHGRSKTWKGITTHLDANAERHAMNWGCVWNRDIDDIVEKSGLKIDTINTFHFGTTYYIIGSPKENF